MAKRYDVVVPHKYTRDGEEKTAWKNVGTMVKFDATGDKPESYLLELSMFPTTDFKVFEQKPRDMGNVPNTTVPYPVDESEIPF